MEMEEKCIVVVVIIVGVAGVEVELVIELAV